jgi:hypothetical protein
VATANLAVYIWDTQQDPHCEDKDIKTRHKLLCWKGNELHSSIKYKIVNLSLHLIMHHTMKMHGRVEMQLHALLTLAVKGG